MIALIIGAVSALLYLWRRRWIDAVLVAVASGALASMGAELTVPASRELTLSADTTLTEARAAQSYAIDGDGLSDERWRDLAARPLRWVPPLTDTLELNFPRQLALGRVFTLKAIHKRLARLELIAENGEVVAEAKGDTVQWLPPVAERVLLKTRLYSADNKLIAEGPVPLVVGVAPPLQIRGRFGAPSFDLRALNELLDASGALLDWQVTLGKGLARAETARAPMPEPNATIIDAAWFENAGEPARAALLADDKPLLILGANARPGAAWSHVAALVPQAEGETAGPLPMTKAPFVPAQWENDGVLWKKGRITWLGVGGWHRHAIGEPRALALWWQDVLDRAGLRRKESVMWDEPRGMPIAGERLVLCQRGVAPNRADMLDAACSAMWPREPGWLTVSGHSTYVFAASDWPLWQAFQHRAATARYMARTKEPTAQTTTPLPAWPFAALFALAMLALWWRERRRIDQNA